MKVFIITKEPFPNGMAATNRIKCYARAIQDGGVECEVLIYGSTELNPKSIRNTEADGCYCGVKFKYIGGTCTDFRPRPIRLVGQYIRIIKTGKYLQKNLKRGDVLFLFMGGKVELMLKFMRIAKKAGAYCVRDLCELPYGTGKETERTIRLRKRILERQFPSLDGVISISDALLNLAKTYTVSTCKHIKVPIMVEYESYYMHDCSSDAEYPYIFHSGTLYQQKDGIIGMIEAFGLATQHLNSTVGFISTGNPEKTNEIEKNEIKSLIMKYNLDHKIRFTGFISNEELKDYLGKASMVIINKYRTQQNNYCFSTKLGEYLAASKPVIITNVGEAMNWLVDGETAFVVEPEDIEVLSNAIVKVFRNPEEARRIGKAGQELCKNSFDYRVWSKPLVEFMNQLGK